MPELIPAAPGSPEWLAARHTVVPGKQAEIDLGLWNAWYGAKFEADRWAETARDHESRLREQAGDAQILTVDGRPVARRIISTHTATWTKDYYRRIGQKEDENG